MKDKFYNTHYKTTRYIRRLHYGLTSSIKCYEAKKLIENILHRSQDKKSRLNGVRFHKVCDDWIEGCTKDLAWIERSIKYFENKKLGDRNER